MILFSLVAYQAFLQLLLVPTRSETRWDFMNESKMSEFYFPYEKCVLQLTDETFDYHNTIFNQPLCTHLLNLTFSNQTLENVNKRCWIGAKQQRQDDGICVGPPEIDLNIPHRLRIRKESAFHCVPLTWRPSLKKYWANVPNNIYPAGELLSTISNMSFDLLTFYGDSMALQLAQHILCSVVRGRHHSRVKFYGDFFSMRVDGASASIDVALDVSCNKINNISCASSKSLGITFSRNLNKMGNSLRTENHSGSNTDAPALCRLNISCLQSYRENFIYDKTVASFRYGKKWSKSLNVVMLPIKLKEEWEYRPYARAIVDLSKLSWNSSSRILVISPLAQHFKSHVNGLYDNFVKPITFQIINVTNATNILAIPKRACGPIQNVLPEHPDMTIFKRYLAEYEPNYNRYIGFFDSFSHTIQLHDLHPETHSTGWSVDCTHFIYTPVLFDSLFYGLSQYLKGSHAWKIHL